MADTMASYVVGSAQPFRKSQPFVKSVPTAPNPCWRSVATIWLAYYSRENCHKSPVMYLSQGQAFGMCHQRFSSVSWLNVICGSLYWFPGSL